MLPSIFRESLLDDWFDFPLKMSFLERKIRCMASMQRI